MEQVTELRDSFKSGVMKDVEFRKDQLRALLKMCVDNEEKICEALKKDLNKSKLEALMCEVNLAKMEINDALKHLDSWVTPEKVSKSFVTLTDSLSVQYQPYGVVLIIGPWNYPFQLSIIPLVGAIAAGNCILLKPSEVAVQTQNLLAELLPKYLDNRIIKVFLGGAKETGDLLKQRFDFICYTGNPVVAKIVMEAAAKHLTPVLLELGGKSPVYLHQDSDLTMAAHRIAWGKCLNAGQTCVAPDYLMLTKDMLEPFLVKFQEAVHEFYGQNVSESPDYCRIINSRHYDRVMQLVNDSKGKVVKCGGEPNQQDRYIGPTVIVDAKSEDSTMKDEIFGPLLPIVTVNNVDEAINFINEREKPLAAYVFTKNKDIVKKFEQDTSSGALVINDVTIHAAMPNLPFGGVGNSGMGNYHGKYSFLAFSHHRAFVNKDTTEYINNKLRYPPSTPQKLTWMNWALSSSEKGWSCCTM